MELSPEGLAAAASTRQAAKKRSQSEDKPVANGAAAANPAAGVKRQQGPGGRPLATCTHEVAIPEGYDEAAAAEKLDPVIHGTLQEPVYTGPRAKEYPFVLDPFQETSVACLERRESVLVSAHTSAGKTVVAEYAIAMAFRAQQRVIYTSPLKALSNQKFRELSEAFGGDVGLMTGDVSLNPNASCIVMTTEILRSMIYRGSELLREVAWVVFDEVHYMQDRERGVVWEETIIFLDHHTKMVFLSATLSNSSQFAAWVAHLHKTPCHVVYTDYRPTPLQHYAYPLGGEGLYLLLDERGNFRTENFERVKESLAMTAGPSGGDGGEDGADGGGADGGGGGRGGGRGGRGGRGRGRGGRGGGRGPGGKPPDMREQVATILQVIKLQKWEPVIFFSFSRRDCEQYANALVAKRSKDKGGNDKDPAADEAERERERLFDFNSAEEKTQVEEIYANALQCLSEEDRELKPIARMLPLLRRGIGVHHSGLLPILKELIEILFQEGLLKVLFTTETFAMGLNMPARCVVFTAMKKWDGTENRWVSSGEYIQMSGRAGRRGMDDRGLCVMMLDAALDEATVRGIMQGKPSPLISSFKLTYYTMLNMLRRLEGSEAGSMAYVIAHSFQQFQQEAQLPKMEKELGEIEAEMAALGKEGEEAMASYQQLRTDISEAAGQLQALLTQPNHCLSFLRAGRLVRVSSGGVDWGTGVVVSVMRRPDAPPAAEGEDDRDAYLVDCILSLDAASLPAAAAPQPQGQQPPQAAAEAGPPRPAPPGSPGSAAEVVPVTLSCLGQLHSLRISVPPDLRPAEARRQVMVQVGELLKRHGEAGLPRLDPIEDMDIRHPQLPEIVARIEGLEAQLVRNPVYKAEKDAAKFAPYLKRAALAARAEELRAAMRTSQLAAFREEAACRTAVLRRLGHIDEEDVVTLKGRAACEIDTADELLASELLLNGTFSGLDSHALVALASCLIPVEKSTETIKLTTQLAEPLAQLQAAARHIAEVSRECKLDLDPEEYVDGFKPALMDVIYAWSKGASFAQVCEMTDIFEGSLVRATRRLDELMGQLANAAAAVGDNELAAKIRAAAETIRRDIMFAASLYI
ncbi:hypothetical protein HXX76_010153 [Chlamydomonas incerta]|uniref:Uncharacterized protein n=1 Tax=Chlamydomonas incerta TaxID=51695 RepID=A0A835SUK2_CHLIN|nr:hypothetical protein HXX76_010153 [Chlamydomonas incerta]|eukprot:KAG2430053.1 hypothetical protein HXX76_010153 [Chlamydomonas incerta]